MSAYDSTRDEIAVTYDDALESSSFKLRAGNIMSFAVLDRRGLTHWKRERRLLLHRTPLGENVYIQYPGKESIREGLNYRPWDFRPKLEMRNGLMAPDLSFTMVWSDLQRIAERDFDALPVIATLMFRMAMMVDHAFVDSDYQSQYIYNHNVLEPEPGPEVRLPYLRYTPPNITVDLLQKRLGHIGGVSVEAYLLQNEYIAQNEDCKYYYRGEFAEGRRWNGWMGRVNTLMTHLSVISVLLGIQDYSSISDVIESGTGVAPLDPRLLPDVTDGIVDYDM